MVDCLLEEGDVQMATIVALSWYCLFRTASELLPRRMQDVSLPGEMTDHGSISLKKTKARKDGMDCATLMDNIGTDLLVMWYAMRRQQGAGPDARLFTLSARTMRRRFKACLKDLDIPV